VDFFGQLIQSNSNEGYNQEEKEFFYNLIKQDCIELA
jgi:hypothetical protein